MEDFSAGQEEFLKGNYSKAIKNYRTSHKVLSSMAEEERNGELIALCMRFTWTSTWHRI